MGFTTTTFASAEPEVFVAQPLMERVKTLAVNWVDNGFGVPRMVHVIYVVKLAVFYVIGGVAIATVTSGLPAFWHVGQWWDQPIVYQKVILWTVVLELLGLAGSWGPLAGKTKPMTGGFRFWARPNTIRLRPWRRVPFTAGDRRTWFDIAVYVALVVTLVVALVSPGIVSGSLAAALPDNTSGLVSPALLVAPMVLLVLIGLRDKTIFLAARGEQYLPALFFFATLPFIDMIIACKLLICLVWLWAGISKFGMHFTSVIPPMVSNSPTMPLKWLKRAHYRNFPTTFGRHIWRPSWRTARGLSSRSSRRWHCCSRRGRGSAISRWPSWSAFTCSSSRRSRSRFRWNGTHYSVTPWCSCSWVSRTGRATQSGICPRPG